MNKWAINRIGDELIKFITQPKSPTKKIAKAQEIENVGT